MSFLQSSHKWWADAHYCLHLVLTYILNVSSVTTFVQISSRLSTLVSSQSMFAGAWMKPVWCSWVSGKGSEWKGSEWLWWFWLQSVCFGTTTKLESIVLVCFLKTRPITLAWSAGSLVWLFKCIQSHEPLHYEINPVECLFSYCTSGSGQN